LVWPDKSGRRAAPQPDVEVRSEVDDYLLRFSRTFDLDVGVEQLRTARDGILRYLEYLRHDTLTSTSEWPLLLHNSIEYAIYRIAQRFGFVDETQEDPCIAYGSVGSRFIEVMDR